MNKNYQKLLSHVKNAGFTLIELLVVVLIIGILAAIAVPQYEKAVDKSRYTNMMSVVEKLKDAQELFYLATGKYAENFEDLDIEMPAGGTLTGYPEGPELKYPQFSLRIILEYGYVFGINHTKPTVGHLLYLNQAGWRAGWRLCYAYNKEVRANALCQSLGGVKEGAESPGGIQIYRLP